MDQATLAKLNRINQEFYQEFAASFSQTRRNIQPGVSRVLQGLPRNGNWLDIGCGNGNLARAWVHNGCAGTYFGIDFSPGLIADARREVKPVSARQELAFLQVDLTSEGWLDSLSAVKWNGFFFFAVLHHIPGETQRRKLCAGIRKLLASGTCCWVSVWQPRSSPRLVKRILPWDLVGLAPEAVDPGDVLMDWRADGGIEAKSPAFRYVHIFSEVELEHLAKQSGFHVVDRWYSDGKGGNLGLYQQWAVDY